MAATSRGALCSICSGVGNVGNYFYNSNVNISQSSYSSFITIADNAINCMAGITNNQGHMDNVINEVLSYYV